MGRRGRCATVATEVLYEGTWPAIGPEWGPLLIRNTVEIRVTQREGEDVARLTVWGAKVTYGVAITAPLWQIDALLARLPNPLPRAWLIDRGAESTG